MKLQAQYEAVMVNNTAGLSATPSNWPNNPNRPVDKISWEDIQVFLEILNEQESANIPKGWAYALPTKFSGNLPVVLVHLLSTGGR